MNVFIKSVAASVVAGLIVAVIMKRYEPRNPPKTYYDMV